MGLRSAGRRRFPRRRPRLQMGCITLTKSVKRPGFAASPVVASVAVGTTRDIKKKMQLILNCSLPPWTIFPMPLLVVAADPYAIASAYPSNRSSLPNHVSVLRSIPSTPTACGVGNRGVDASVFVITSSNTNSGSGS
ncbi:hypothetical protein RHSIM_Rhsim01G0231500 [Rhododendron simsii]|uniref:Uncharacterized protein n=1 Tax=Rhododendron simsii TaxID=118357 RepID=A0A834HJT4_RHOSS|nr:hypothetical protein RHSIM_Rhsim01G0231500 [Rhododendron simsii]